MKLTIQNTTAQPTLHRKTINARLFFTQETPSRQEVAQALAKEVGADRDKLVVATIHTSFGESSAHVEARVYDDEKFMHDLERANLLEKNKKVEPEPEPEPEPEAAEEPAQEASEEDSEESAEEKDEQASAKDKDE